MKFKSLVVSLFCLIFSVAAFGQAALPPVTAVVKVGQQATLNVTADGTTPFSYQWNKNGVAIAGATSNPLVITNAPLTAAGTYTVIVSNSAGSTTSNDAILQMLGAPVFSTQPVANTTKVVGQSVALTVLATGTPAPTYQWMKNGVAIAGATSATFTIPSATTTDSGTYTCVATSTLSGVTNSTTSNNAVVVINVAAPTITGITITVQ